METKKWVGGAFIDGTRASYPFAELYADSQAIRLKVPSLKWDWVFEREYISKISFIKGLIPFLGGRIRIEHTKSKSNYPRDIIFSTFGNKKLIAELKEMGFLIG